MSERDEVEVLPEQRHEAQSRVTRVLWKTFRSSTGVDLDRLAEEIVAALIDPVLSRSHERREEAMSRAVTGVIDYMNERVESVEAQRARAVEQRDAELREVDRLATLLRETKLAQTSRESRKNTE